MIRQDNMVIRAVGTFTAPPSPCGNEECGWVELTLVHAKGCEG